MHPNTHDFVSSKQPKHRQRNKAGHNTILTPPTSPCPPRHSSNPQILGVDDTRLIVPLLLIPVLVFISFAGFGAEQDNEDFFDSYDQRRK